MSRISRIVIVVAAVIILAQIIHGVLAIFLGAVAIVVWQILGRGRETQTSMIRDYGFTPDEASAAEKDLARGNKEGVVRSFELARDRKFAEMRARGIDPEEVTIVIGKDAKWSDVTRQVFRVLEFDPADTKVFEDGTIKAASTWRPYGYLLVESPILNFRASLPIVHRDDYYLATTVFDDPQGLELLEQGELLVTYYPERNLPGARIVIHHGLHYVIVPHGTLEQYYCHNDGEYMREPALDKLFTRITWQGEIAVEVNLNLLM